MGVSTKISGKFIFILLFSIIFVSFLGAQEVVPQSEDSAPVSELKQRESELLIADQAVEQAVDSVGQTGTAWFFIRLIFVLILVIACIYAIVWLLRKSGNPKFAPDPYLKKVASLNLGPGKSVYIVSTPTQAFMVGVTDNSVNKIGEITDKDLIDMMNINVEKQPVDKPKDFASILSKFFNSGTNSKSGSFSSYFENSAGNTMEYLQSKRREISGNRDNNGEQQ